MRICLIGGVFGRPAAYQEIVRLTPEIVLARALARRGHEVVTRGHYGPWDYRGFDVVHVHHLAWGAASAAAQARTFPLVFTPHAQVSRSVRRVAMRYVVDRATATIALSQADAAWQRAAYPRVAGRQHVIPNGIDTDVFAFSPPRPPDSGEPWRLLFVGQLIPLKGVDRLLAALARCSAGINLTLDLAYQVDDEEPALRRQAHALGLQVNFLGPRTPEQLAELYRRCHLFVLPSVTEALPSVVSEAIISGRPVVATDLPGVREQVGSFGALVAGGAPEALATALTQVIENYAVIQDAARRASEDAARHYSIAAMADGHEALYARLEPPPGDRSRSGVALDRLVARVIPFVAARRRPGALPGEQTEGDQDG